MAGHGEKLSRKQEAAIAALLTEPTIEAAARSIGVGERTIRRWMQLDGFRAQYRQARQALVEGAVSELQRASGEAVRVLREVAADPETPASARVAAARALLSEMYRGVEIIELDERIGNLEQMNKQGDEYEPHSITSRTA